MKRGLAINDNQIADYYGQIRLSIINGFSFKRACETICIGAVMMYSRMKSVQRTELAQLLAANYAFNFLSVNKEYHDKIIEATANYFQMSPEKFLLNTGRAIDQETAYRKHICYYMIRHYTFMSYDDIGIVFFKEQSCIRFGVEKINDLLFYNSRTITDVRQIKILIDNFNAKTNTDNGIYPGAA